MPFMADYVLMGFGTGVVGVPGLTCVTLNLYEPWKD
jgi:hypothetical protein